MTVSWSSGRASRRRKPKPEYDVTVIEKRELIRRSAPEVFAFMDRPANWKSAFPDSLAVRLEQHPSDLRPGTIFRYRLHRWPVDVSWDVVVSEYRPPTRFTNVKARGYFPRWVLEHEIRAPGRGRGARDATLLRGPRRTLRHPLEQLCNPGSDGRARHRERTGGARRHRARTGSASRVLKKSCEPCASGASTARTGRRHKKPWVCRQPSRSAKHVATRRGGGVPAALMDAGPTASMH